jgi:two-component system, chemotaxis family, protein-glutamate methylesterase/glutaminase
LPHTVLVVDDNSVMRQALCKLFHAAQGFEICGEAANGLEAVEMAAELRPALVVLDLYMPGINGLETARRLRRLAHPPPVILYSMNAEEIAENQAYECGVAAVVSKAEGIKSLITKARAILGEAEAQAC